MIFEGAIRKLKAERDGEIEVAGPDLVKSLTELGLLDAYRIYLHPVVLGHGKPYFAGPQQPLRLVSRDRIGEDVLRLTTFLHDAIDIFNEGVRDEDHLPSIDWRFPLAGSKNPHGLSGME